MNAVNNGTVSTEAFGPRGQAYLKAAGNGDLNKGAEVANRHCDSYHPSGHDGNPYNSASANAYETNQQDLNQWATARKLFGGK